MQEGSWANNVEGRWGRGKRGFGSRGVQRRAGHKGGWIKRAGVKMGKGGSSRKRTEVKVDGEGS